MTRKLLLAAILSLVLATSANAQGMGTIVGTVTDPSGAVVPSAKIALTESGTGLSRTALSGPSGNFVLPSLRPSNYSLTVEATGFRQFNQQGITLQADQTVTVNVKLVLGRSAETVTVEATGELVNSVTPTLSGVVDQRRMVDLPLNGRNAASLTLLVPGAVSAPGDGADQGQTKTFPGAVTISTNGSRQNQISYQLDGGNNVDEYTNVNQPFPFPDALQEFSVQTSNYSAEYGQNSGGVVNVVTKSGTNGLHGDLFEFDRNAVFNARNFFSAQRDQLKRNQFGGTVGGPIRKDKTFFFAGYQGTRLRNVGNTSSAFVPTAAELNGDFSAFLDKNNPNNPLGKAFQLKNPFTGATLTGNIINPSLFDSASLGVLKFLPLATSGNGLIFFTKPVRQNFNETIGRVDHSFSEKDQLTGRYYYDRFANAPVFSPTNILPYADGSTITSQNILLHETHIFRPNLLSDARLSYSREASSRGPASSVPGVRDFGVNIPFQPPSKAIESVNASGFFSFGDNPPARFVRNNFTWSEDISWVAGRHDVKFGGVFERSRVDITNLFHQEGIFSFSGDSSGVGLVDFLFGKIRNFVQGFGEYKNNRNYFPGFYVQDSFRVTRRLALNYGLRYEPSFPWDEIRNRVEQFQINAFAAGRKSTVFVNAPAGLLFPGDAGFPTNGITADLNNFAPRVGFAYDLTGDGKTSVRGGAGLFYDSRQDGIINNRFVDLTPFSPQVNVTPPPGPFRDPYCLQTTGCTPGVSPFPAPFPPPSNAPFPPPVQVVTYNPSNKFVSPLIYNWNLTLERQFASSWLARTAYVGSRGNYIRQDVELNPAQPTSASNPGSLDARRILQPYASVRMGDNGANSSYHSLQLTLEKRFTQGFTLLANYTYSKSLDTLPAGGDITTTGASAPSALPWFFSGVHRIDYGPSDFDHTHRLVVSYVWQLPKLSNSNAAARGVLGNWKWTGIVSAQSGSVFTVTAGKDRSQTGLNQDRAVALGPALGSGACKTAAPCVDYLNPSSFDLPALGQFGNVGKDSLRGPNQFGWDMGMFKDIPLTERWRLEFRAEFFNIFNRVNFNNPTTSRSSGGFGQIRGAGDPRIGQLALKIFF